MLKTFLGFTILVPAPRFNPEHDHFSHGFWGDRIGFLLETYEPNPDMFSALSHSGASIDTAIF
ncbi:hypothetical protein HGRIS_001078 [Hohenbuehelia grisea]|uniref:Uncharacterized protein n=1 Tax=Hohenbuehelia grisea TaxID=104357 RepID=A0ABR3JNS2_9AGAR